MFRCVDNTPEVYSHNSRDFQLLCNLFDASQGWTKDRIDSIISATSTTSCDVALIPLLCKKLGFFKNVDVDDDTLRYILCGFPHIMKNKGTLYAMQCMVNLVHRLFNDGNPPPVLIMNHHTNSVEIESSVHMPYESLLVEMLSMIAPAGVTLEVGVSVALSANDNVKFVDESTISIYEDGFGTPKIVRATDEYNAGSDVRNASIPLNDNNNQGDNTDEI